MGPDDSRVVVEKHVKTNYNRPTVPTLKQNDLAKYIYIINEYKHRDIVNIKPQIQYLTEHVITF